jgi:uncharacterized protein YndB with AHSA1/START domain
MKLIKWLIILGVVGFGGAWLYGRSQPSEHFATSSIVMVAPADSVWKVVRNIDQQPSWWSDVKGVRRLTGQRRESWEQNMGAAGMVRVEVTRVTPGRQLVLTVLNDEQQDWGGVWTYDVMPSASGTEVRITEEGWVDSPFVRVVMKLRGKFRVIDSYLRSLGAHFNESVSPRHG